MTAGIFKGSVAMYKYGKEMGPGHQRKHWNTAIPPVKLSARSQVRFWPRPANALPDNLPEQFEEWNETVMVSIR